MINRFDDGAGGSCPETQVVSDNQVVANKNLIGGAVMDKSKATKKANGLESVVGKTFTVIRFGQGWVVATPRKN